MKLNKKIKNETINAIVLPFLHSYQNKNSFFVIHLLSLFNELNFRILQLNVFNTINYIIELNVYVVLDY